MNREQFELLAIRLSMLREIPLLTAKMELKQMIQEIKREPKMVREE